MLLRSVGLGELEQLQSLFPEHGKVLELCEGNGYQASIIGAWAYEVESIDVRVGGEFLKVKLYDGEHVACLEASIDLILSSYVPEYISRTKLQHFLSRALFS